MHLYSPATMVPEDAVEETRECEEAVSGWDGIHVEKEPVVT